MLFLGRNKIFEAKQGFQWLKKKKKANKMASIQSKISRHTKRENYMTKILRKECVCVCVHGHEPHGL